MKKTIIMGIVISLFTVLSGCDLLDKEVMFCVVESAKGKPHFEISYKGNDIIDVKITESIDYSNLNESQLSSKVKFVEKLSEKEEEYDGISIDVNNDGGLITKKTTVDYETYNVIKDKLNLFHFEVSKRSFKDVETIRNILESESYTCDELVKE